MVETIIREFDNVVEARRADGRGCMYVIDGDEVTIEFHTENNGPFYQDRVHREDAFASLSYHMFGDR